MKKSIPITTLFVDIGGVLLTNGWDHHARRRAAKHFKLNWAEMQERHELNFETHEEDKITFQEYLDQVIFWLRAISRAHRKNDHNTVLQNGQSRVRVARRFRDQF